MKPGLVSITFRKLAPREIVDLCVACNLCGIEWGGDVHVPHGDIRKADEVARMTRDAGLETAAYGSYYRAGHSDVDFETVLETALRLKTGRIRVWAGCRASADADAAYQLRVADDLCRICDMAAKHGIGVVTEWHSKTLTDTAESARQLLNACSGAGLRTYWQPRTSMTMQERLKDMQAALPFLAGLHVFQWESDGAVRLPLMAGELEWKQFLAQASVTDADYALLEFVRNDDPEQLRLDAVTLEKWMDF